MRWLDGDSEMKFFSKEREVRYDDEGKYREFNLHNVRTGTVFCRLRIYDDRTEIRTLDFFNEIKKSFNKTCLFFLFYSKFIQYVFHLEILNV
jgi:hypothetical protein